MDPRHKKPVRNKNYYFSAEKQLGPNLVSFTEKLLCDIVLNVHNSIIWTLGLWAQVQPIRASDLWCIPSNQQAGLVSGKQKTRI